MLEDYFRNSCKSEEEAIQKTQRLLAVQAALEIAKATVGSPSSAAGSKTDRELKFVAEGVSKLADAIQDALNK